jgi:2,3-bisphosphoglycerate-dependent phosphoglycerate mutase
MAARLCMVRHGETAWNAEGRVQGQLDIPLSAAGLAQAQSVAGALPSGRFSALYSSDLARVRQTAQPAAAKLGLEMRVEACLRERHYGAFQGLTYVQAKQSLPADYARFKAKDPQFAFGSGESLGCGLSTPRRCELPNAALNWIEVDERQWSVLGWADCAHLAAALDDLAG